MRLIKILFLTTLLALSLNAREQVNVNFSDLQINDFIKLISKITHKNILINNKINGTVNFVSTTPVYDDELIGILVSVLESKGFTLIKKGSIYEVVRSTEAAKHNVRVVNQGNRVYGSLMVTQAIKVKGENVDVVAAKIRYLISKTAKLMTMKESNTLLLTDYPKNIETIKKVIKGINSNSTMIVKIMPIKHAEAKKLQGRLLEISKSIFNSKVASEQVKIILDDNINGVIVIGNKANIVVIEKLLKKMDVESHASNGIQIFALKNSDAKAVATTLNDIISKQKFSDPSMKPNISASEEINAIIAIGEPSILKGVKLIIDELDKEKYQVYVQARIINVFNKKAIDLGVKYGFDAAGLSTGGLYSLGTTLTGSAISGDLGKLIGLSAITSGATSGFALGAAISFLEQNNASQSISDPSILCVNNKESSIYVGQTISISTGTISNAVNTGNLTSSFKRQDVGLTLKIKPRVSSKDKVTLEVETILESVVSYGDPETGAQPVTAKQEVKTQTILRNAESIIIGGLTKQNKIKKVSKLPLLGDIPWIGEYLFSSTSDEIEETNLIVVLTPYVIDKSEHLSKLQQELGVISKMQDEYNIRVFKEFYKKNQDDKNTEPKQEEKKSLVIEEVEE